MKMSSTKVNVSPRDGTSHRSVLSGISMLVEFSRAKLISAVTFSAATGYFMFSKQLAWEVLLPVLGVFFLGCGCSGINQIQEAKTDAIMDRTRNRPIPSGRLDIGWAWFWAIMMILTGLYFLASIENNMWLILGLALFSLVWYSAVYTYLKKYSAFAVVPGALLGIVPPLMGWSTAGGVWWDQRILLLLVYFFVWQIPHFWLLMLLRGKEYEQAGLASMTQLFSQEQFYRITFLWLMASAVIGFLVALLGRIDPIWILAILISSVWLVIKSLFFLSPKPRTTQLRPAFIRSIVYTVLLMLFLSLDALI